MHHTAIEPLAPMLPRNLFQSEHMAFRRTVQQFYQHEVCPHIARFEAQQHVDRELWQKAGALGLLCCTLPEVYGGSGVNRLYSMILLEEQAYAMDSSTGFSLHSDIVANYILNFGDDAQKQHWLPKMARGDAIGAIAMTEPSTGSDLQAIRTSAKRDGDDYIITGSKIFITNGYLCDLALVVARSAEQNQGAQHLSIFIVEATREGFSKGQPLNKIGMKGQDTCELFFNNVRVPAHNRLGSEGAGFAMLMAELAWERMLVAILSQAGAEAAFAHTVSYCKQRHAFGKPLMALQNTRFELADMRSKLDLSRCYVDHAMQAVLHNNLSVDAAAAAKYQCSDLYSSVVDRCLQLHGGYGYMLDYPIARAYIDNRANRIYAGSNEIMKELIARGL